MDPSNRQFTYHRFSGVGVISVIADDRLLVDLSIHIKRIQSLVPVNMASQIHINTMIDQDFLKGVSHVLLIRGSLRAIHRTMCHCDNPWSLISIDFGEIFLQPVVLFVRFVLSVVTLDIAEWSAVGDVGVLLLWLIGLAVGLCDEWILWAIC